MPEPPRPRPLRTAMVCFFGLALVVGALSGLAWFALVDLPGYVVAPDGSASTSERGLAKIIAIDAWFVLLGLISATGLGLLAWRWFRTIGWQVVLVAVVGALAASLCCLGVGYGLGPNDFTERLAAAEPGQFVPVQLSIRSRISLAVWPFAATIPILMAAALSAEPDSDAGKATPRAVSSDDPVQERWASSPDDAEW